MTSAETPRRLRTRARILAAAEPLFHEQGLRKVTVEDICGAAGVSRRTFYQHFDGREALATAVLENIIADISGPLSENLESRRPAAEVIRRHFELVADLAYSRVSSRFFSEIEADLPDAFRLIVDSRRRVINGLVTAIRRGQREGSILPGLKPAAIGKIMNSVLENSVSPAFALENELTLPEIGETLTMLFQNGLFVSKNVPASGGCRRPRKPRSDRKAVAGGPK